MEDKKVSIIVPVYNCANYINDCFDSIIGQSYENLEIIVVDDGSTDETYPKVLDIKKTDKRIVLYHNENHGVSYSRNFAIDHSSGDYLLFVDADDVIHIDFVSKLVSLISQDDVDCGVCNIQSFKNGKTPNFPILNDTTTFVTSGEAFEGLFGKFHGYMANKIYKRSIICSNNVRLQEDLAIAEDMLFNQQYLRFCKSVSYTSKVLYLYRQYEESAFNNLYNVKWFSILESYKRLITNCNNIKVINYYAIPSYVLLVEEAKYRIKLMQREKMDCPDISCYQKHASSLVSKLSFKNKLKTTIFRLFPRLVMSYKRRDL